MKMKKKAFHITVFPEANPVVSGLVSQHFGIHKARSEKSYHITHLPSGCRIPMCKSLTQKEARKFVELLETRTFPVLWNEIELKILYENGLGVLEIKEELNLY